MTKLDTAPYKGVQDFYPEDMVVQNYIFDTWKNVAQRFGYAEYSASPLEPTELYTEKSGNEIINQQTFTFTDRGGRSVTLRPEMTPTLARMVAARRRSLKFPLRWFSIPNLFRYEKPQRGRRREHYQFNADILGVADISADVEIVNIAYSILKEFGANDSNFEIWIDHAKGDKKQIDEFVKLLAEKGINNVRTDKEFARGQAYYTGLVFEFYDSNSENSRSIFGGGRYDNLMELFDSELIPAVGIACGDIITRDFLETHGLRTNA